MTRVPGAAFITIIFVECAGVFCAFLLSRPSRILRHDRRAIAHFESLTWIQEMSQLLEDITTVKILLLAPAFIACNMPISLIGSLNGFRFNARTRTLITVGSLHTS